MLLIWCFELLGKDSIEAISACKKHHFPNSLVPDVKLALLVPALHSTGLGIGIDASFELLEGVDHLKHMSELRLNILTSI